MVKNDPVRVYGLENLPFSSIFRPFWSLFNALGTQIGFKIGYYIAKWSLERGDQLMLSSIRPKEHKFWSKTIPKKKVQKNWYRIGWKHPNGHLFLFRFGLTLVVFGRFPRPKKWYFWPKIWFLALFRKVTIFFRHSIIIICHLVTFHFPCFSWTLLGIGYPQWVPPPILPLSVFYFVLIFLTFLLEKIMNIEVFGNVPGNVFFFTFSGALLVLPF